MDAVITYVNGADPLWQAQYAAFSGKEPPRRFRDWGMLPLQIRNIRRYLPFVEKIFLVVALPSQVPEGLPEDVEVILHKEIIPEKFLPTFNSTAIEMFLHRIPGLDDRYLYINDDCIPVMPCTEEDFFEGNRIVKGFSRHLFAPNLYKKRTRNADRLARRAARRLWSPVFLRPQHTVSPMLRTACEDVFEKKRKQIEASISPTREGKNINQYLFLDYMYHVGMAVNRRLSSRHISLAAIRPKALASFLRNPDRKWVCINDVDLPEKRLAAFRRVTEDCL